MYINYARMLYQSPNVLDSLESYLYTDLHFEYHDKLLQIV